jgi:hypothetical protein
MMEAQGELSEVSKKKKTKKLRTMKVAFKLTSSMKNIH